MGPDASIGPITPDGEAVKVDYREPVKILARRKGKEQDLFAGLLDRDADLKLVRTADRQAHYLMPENLEAFRKANAVLDADVTPAWEGGSRGVLTSARAREEGLAKLRAADRAEIANVYRISTRALSNDPTLLQEPKPVWIAIEGRIDPIKEAYLRRRIEQARREGVNLVFFKMNTQRRPEHLGQQRGHPDRRHQGHEDGRLCRRPGHRRLGPDGPGLRRHRLPQRGHDGRR